MKTLALLCSLFFAEAAGASRFVEQLRDGKPATVVVYGTSLTAAGAWPAQMKAALDAVFPGRMVLINSGGSGMTSEWGVRHLGEKVIAHQPDAVFIEFSVNDAVHRFGISLRQSRRNLERMLDGISEANPDTEIILQVMNPVIDRPEGHDGWRPRLAEYQQVYREVGKERGLLVIDHMPAWQAVLEKSEEVFRGFTIDRDGLHPNACGLARHVTPVILEKLGVPPLSGPADE
jgi:acyl-CoA thioesterase I